MSKTWLRLLSLLSLAGCLAAPILHFFGRLSSRSNKLIFLGASAAWFVFATLWARRK